jgi:K+-sensing histidine kinase KdpD
MRRVLLALRPVSPVERLFEAGAALARRMDADLEVVADPEHPRWADIVTRLSQLARGDLDCRLTPIPGLDIRQVVDYARSHEGIVSVVVGRPGAWASNAGVDHWARLECPLVAASDSPGQPHEA